MSFDIANFVSPAALRVLKTAGLHKMAGVMAGIDELTMKEAVATIGAKAHLRHCEMRKMADGINALAELHGEKVAGPSILSALAQHAVTPGLLGAGIGAGSELMNEGPVNMERLVSRALMGGGIGMAGGMASHLGRASAANPSAAAAMSESIGQTL